MLSSYRCFCGPISRPCRSPTPSTPPRMFTGLGQAGPGWAKPCEAQGSGGARRTTVVDLPHYLVSRGSTKLYRGAFQCPAASALCAGLCYRLAANGPSLSHLHKLAPLSAPGEIPTELRLLHMLPRALELRARVGKFEDASTAQRRGENFLIRGVITPPSTVLLCRVEWGWSYLPGRDFLLTSMYMLSLIFVSTSAAIQREGEGSQLVLLWVDRATLLSWKCS